MTREQEERVKEKLNALKPAQQLRVSIDDGHEVLAMLTDQDGFHTGRPRFLVVCVTCEELLHHATTGPVEHMKRHTS